MQLEQFKKNNKKKHLIQMKLHKLTKWQNVNRNVKLNDDVEGIHNKLDT